MATYLIQNGVNKRSTTWVNQQSKHSGGGTAVSPSVDWNTSSSLRIGFYLEANTYSFTLSGWNSAYDASSYAKLYVECYATWLTESETSGKIVVTQYGSDDNTGLSQNIGSNNSTLSFNLSSLTSAARSSLQVYAYLYRHVRTDMTLYGYIKNMWLTKNVTLTYNNNGGGTVPSAETFEEGSHTISTTTPSRTGYTFKGYATSAGGSATYQPGNTITVTSNTTLYAVWQAITYTVAYNKNADNTVANMPSNQTKTYGVDLTLSNNTPTRSNASAGSYTVTLRINYTGGTDPSALTAARTTSYTFSKWNTAANGSGTNYNKGATYSANAAATMYAQWSGSTSTAAVTLPTPTRTGYTFKGWSTSSTATTGTTGSYTPTGNVTLYAIWQINTYTVSYNANGGSGAPGNQTKTYGVTLTLSSTKPTKSSSSAGSYTITLKANYTGGTDPSALTANRTTSYTFSKWNTKSDGTGTNYNSGANYTANEAATMYAQYTSSTTTAAVTLPTPTRTGYTCLGWSTSSSATAASYSCGGSYTFNANTTLYAVWQVNLVSKIYIGTSRVNKVYIGTSRVKKIYVGTTIVFDDP